jgi:hypothetical protein
MVKRTPRGGLPGGSQTITINSVSKTLLGHGLEVRWAITAAEITKEDKEGLIFHGRRSGLFNTPRRRALGSVQCLEAQIRYRAANSLRPPQSPRVQADETEGGVLSGRHIWLGRCGAGDDLLQQRLIGLTGVATVQGPHSAQSDRGRVNQVLFLQASTHSGRLKALKLKDVRR